MKLNRDNANESPIGKEGRVTGTIAPDTTGEVKIFIRGGSELFYAYADDPNDTIPLQTRIVVIDYHPPREVTVSRID